MSDNLAIVENTEERNHLPFAVPEDVAERLGLNEPGALPWDGLKDSLIDRNRFPAAFLFMHDWHRRAAAVSYALRELRSNERDSTEKLDAVVVLGGIQADQLAQFDELQRWAMSTWEHDPLVKGGSAGK